MYHNNLQKGRSLCLSAAMGIHGLSISLNIWVTNIVDKPDQHWTLLPHSKYSDVQQELSADIGYLYDRMTWIDIFWIQEYLFWCLKDLILHNSVSLIQIYIGKKGIVRSFLLRNNRYKKGKQ